MWVNMQCLTTFECFQFGKCCEEFSVAYIGFLYCQIVLGLQVNAAEKERRMKAAFLSVSSYISSSYTVSSLSAL